jgi:hypothetical protein
MRWCGRTIHASVVPDDGVKRKLLGTLRLCARMAAYTVYREDQWQRRSMHTETES